MQVIKVVAVGLPIALGVVMIWTGALNFAGPPLARENFARWRYPAGFSPGGRQPRRRGRSTSRDPVDLAGWRERERHVHAGRRRHAPPSSRLWAPTGRNGPNSGLRRDDSNPCIAGPIVATRDD